MGWRMLFLRDGATGFAELLRKGILLTLEATGFRLILLICNGPGMAKVSLGGGSVVVSFWTFKGAGFAEEQSVPFFDK